MFRGCRSQGLHLGTPRGRLCICVCVCGWRTRQTGPGGSHHRPLSILRPGYIIVQNPTLRIPTIRMNDGPQGFRDDSGKATTTQWPCALGMAASWDRTRLWQWGEAMGREFAAKGANVQLGPGICVARVPRNGRNFEYLSGEDPYLGAELVAPAIQGIQSVGVIANAKHYLMNNQVHMRGLLCPALPCCMTPAVSVRVMRTGMWKGGGEEVAEGEGHGDGEAMLRQQQRSMAHGVQNTQVWFPGIEHRLYHRVCGNCLEVQSANQGSGRVRKKVEGEATHCYA